MQGSGRILASGTFIKLTLLAWLAMIGVDFLLHAGVLARLYLEPSPFLLTPQRAFALIPVGYLSFLVLAFFLVWLMARLGVEGWRAGGAFGLQLGALAWGALTLGLLSISTAPLALMIGWFVGQTIEFGIAGMVVGSALAAVPYRRLLLLVLAGLVGAFVITIILQSLGLAPAMRVGGG
jgi:hypothetical protein